jgi:hypothetical protein
MSFLENDDDTVREFGRLLISKNPNRRTLLTLFQHLKLYTLGGRDCYWKQYSPFLEEPLPDSQHKFWDYQEVYERFTHPSRRVTPPVSKKEEEDKDLVPLTKEEEKLLDLLLD